MPEPIDELTTNVNQYIKAVDKLLENKTTIQAEIAKKDKMIAEKQKTIDEKQSEINDLTGKGIRYEEENKLNTEKILELKKEKEKLSNIANEKAELQTKLDEINNKITDLNGKIITAKKNYPAVIPANAAAKNPNANQNPRKNAHRALLKNNIYYTNRKIYN